MPGLSPHRELDGRLQPAEPSLGEIGASLAAPRGVGTLMSELAVCRKSVGVGVHLDLAALELTGQAEVIERLLSRMGFTATLPVGACISVGEFRLARVAEGWTVLLGPAAAVERWLRLARQQARPALDRVGRGGMACVLAAIGPRSAALLESAGVSSGLPAGGAQCAWLDGSAVVVLREAWDRHLLILDRSSLEQVRLALLRAGQLHAMSFVGSDALAMMALAERSEASTGAR